MLIKISDSELEIVKKFADKYDNLPYETEEDIQKIIIKMLNFAYKATGIIAVGKVAKNFIKNLDKPMTEQQKEFLDRCKEYSTIFKKK